MRKLLYIIIIICFQAAGQQNINPNGFNTFYFDNGNKSSEGSLKNGKPEGYWKNYYENGKLKSEGNRKNFLLDSNWKFYSQDGFIKEEIYYQKNKKNGPYIQYADSGILYSISNYVNDTLTGDYKQFYPTGELHIYKNIVNGVPQGRALEYRKDSTIITIVDYDDGQVARKEDVNRFNEQGEKTGVWKFFEDGKLVAEGNYKNGKKDGIFRTYNAKGELDQMQKFEMGLEDVDAKELMFVDLYKEYYPTGEIHFVGAKNDNDQKHGIFQEYDKEGKIIKTYIYREDKLSSKGLIDNKGLRQGKWYFYYPDGEKRAKGAYEDDKKEGEWTYYYLNEQIEQKGVYKSDVEDGEWNWYYDNGQIKRQEKFYKGKREGAHIEYDSTGKVISQGEYLNGLKEGEWFYQVGDHTEKGGYLDGQKNGEWVYEYQNGQINFKGDYKNGFEDGKHVYYYDNGQVKQEGKYSLGRKEGTWKKYDKYGNLIVAYTYKGGVAIKADGIKIKPGFTP